MHSIKSLSIILNQIDFIKNLLKHLILFKMSILTN